MIEVAGSLGWLSPQEKRAELAQMIGEQLARTTLNSADVDLACALNKDRELDEEILRLRLSPAQASDLAHAAVLACFGSPEARRRYC